jgi:tetratricopeptide (TPR) repeat protein
MPSPKGDAAPSPKGDAAPNPFGGGANPGFVFNLSPSDPAASFSFGGDKPAPPAAWSTPTPASSMLAWFDHAPEQGMCVELHSLSKEQLNGRLGECLQWSQEKERWAIRLLPFGLCTATSLKPVLVKTANLRRAPCAEQEKRGQAFDLCCEATTILKSLSSADDSAVEALRNAEMLLSKAEALDFACVTIHQARGDMAMMGGNLRGAILHFRRAVANGYNLKTEDPNLNGGGGKLPGEQQLVRRVALAGALGSAGDLDGEEQQCRLVLAASPGHIQARLTLGQNLKQRGRADDAIPELLMALQLPNTGLGNVYDEHSVGMMRCQAARQIAAIYGGRASKLSRQGKHRDSVSELERLTKILRDVLEGPLLLTDWDRGQAALASHDAPLPLPAGGTVAATFRPDGKAATQLQETVKVVIDLARAEANQAGDLLEMNERAAAAEALERCAAALALHPNSEGDAAMQGRLQYERGKCKEHEADAAAREGNSGEAVRLYVEAKEIYRASNQKCPDAAPRQGFSRVQAKAHPDVEFVQEGPAGFSGGGYARILKPGVQLEEL